MSLSKPQKAATSKERPSNAASTLLTTKQRYEDKDTITEHIRRIDGTELTRKYLKCGLLGKGGFANCFITENTTTKTLSATKIVTKDELRTHRTRLRLANEIKLHKTLHHPNVVEFHHCFEDKEQVFIFLELCENQSLNQLLKVRGTFLTPQIQSFLFGIVNGLKYVHQQKIIHRDLKLGNIFVDGKMNIKIGDFGLATKLQFQRECKRTVCGTPNYIAPEVLDGRGYHFEVDIWSVGVILYTLYYGIPPFETDDANSTYQKIKDCDYLIPKTINTPVEAVDLMRKILVRNPAKRPSLDQILESQFFKVGNGVVNELPLVCAKRAPTKKEQGASQSLLIATEAHGNQNHRDSNKTKETHCGTNAKSAIPNPNSTKPFKKSCPSSSTPANLHKAYTIQFSQLLQDTFYYKLANDQTAILQKGVRLLYRNPSNGKYILKSMINLYEEQANEDCELKYLMMGKQNRFNVLDQTYEKPKRGGGEKQNGAIHDSSDQRVFVKKAQRIQQNLGWILRLSNKSIQLLIEQSSYLIKDSCIWQVTGGKEKQLALAKIKNGILAKTVSSSGNRQHFDILRRVVEEIDHLRGCPEGSGSSKEAKDQSGSSSSNNSNDINSAKV